MSNWLAYDDFVDLVRNHHHDGFTGLITGVSNKQHSFQVGFRTGQIVSLSYRILKGAAALDKLTLINQAKITEHPNIEIPPSIAQLPETSAILSRLTLENQQDITDVDIQSQGLVSSTTETQSSGPKTTLDNNQIKSIKAAAVHHFGPIGVMVCDELLSEPNLSNYHLDALLRRIAQEVGADSNDTQAFLKSAS